MQEMVLGTQHSDEDRLSHTVERPREEPAQSMATTLEAPESSVPEPEPESSKEPSESWLAVSGSLLREFRKS